MSLQENKAIDRQVIEAINQQNLVALDELITPDFVYHMPMQQIQGLEVMKQARAHKVCVRLRETATHKTTFRGVAPTGKKLTYTAITIWRTDGGKIVEGLGIYNQMDFFKQLGVIEYKGFPDEVT